MTKPTAHDEFKPFHNFTTRILDRIFPEDNGKLRGFTLPWGKCAAIRFAPGELSVWSGTNGHGKSLFLSQMMLEAMRQNERVLIASFEMSPDRTAARMIQQAVCHSPDDPAEVVETTRWLGQYGLVNVNTGNMKSRDLLEYMAVFAKEGTSQFVIDSLMKLDIPQDDYNAITAFMNRLAAFAQQLNVHVHLVAHSKKAENEDFAPGKMDVKGPAEITNIPDWVFSVWRNKAKERIMWEYKNTGMMPKGCTANITDVYRMVDAAFTCEKSRDKGEEAEKRFGMFFHRDSMQYLERQDDLPVRYYDHS